MKIRIKGNSLRYRLTKSEIDKFALTGYLQEKISFGANALCYSIKSSPQDQLSASLISKEITLYVPSSFIEKWISTDQVGFEHNMELDGSHELLYLLVEKDFTCLDKTNEDQSDNYPNPLLKNLHEQ